MVMLPTWSEAVLTEMDGAMDGQWMDCRPCVYIKQVLSGLCLGHLINHLLFVSVFCLHLLSLSLSCLQHEAFLCSRCWPSHGFS